MHEACLDTDSNKNFKDTFCTMKKLNKGLEKSGYKEIVNSVRCDNNTVLV